MKKPKSKNLTSSQLAYIKEHYKNESNEKIAEALGLSKWTIKSRAEKHGWHKSKEFISSQCREVAIRCGNAKRINTPEAYAKREETMAKLIKVDRMRIKWGMTQATKRHFRLEPKAKLQQRNRLQRLGYIIDEANLIAYYTPGTHRATRIEAVPRGTTKGNIRAYYDFRPYGEEREQQLDK